MGATGSHWATRCFAESIEPILKRITDPIKAKIFGLNAARLFHVDPTAAWCRVDRHSFA
jgi:hypothetical protein